MPRRRDQDTVGPDRKFYNLLIGAGRMGLSVQLAFDEERDWIELSVIDSRRAGGTMPISTEWFGSTTLEALTLGLEGAIRGYRELDFPLKEQLDS